MNEMITTEEKYIEDLDLCIRVSLLATPTVCIPLCEYSLL